MNTNRVLAILVFGIAAPALAHAQVGAGGGGRGKAVATPGVRFQITESTPIEVTPVKNAPFAARAETEFTQILLDGNRIDRRYESSVARDSRGRTRREEEIALLGPLAAAGATAPRLVTVIDPDAGVSYTIDDEQRVAYRTPTIQNAEAAKLALAKLQAQLKNVASAGDAAPKQATTTDLGSRTIEGVRAQGTRTTQTIAAGAIGNALPIEVVSERWFSPELQMAVLVTRHDPQNGDTVYRLTNVQRGEQADALFAVPPGYEIKNGGKKAFFVSPKK